MRASPRLAASPPPPMALTSLLLVPLLAVAAGAAAGPQPPHAGPAPGPGPASDAQDDAVDPALVDAEAAWLREADTALLAGQLAQLLRAQGEGAPPGAASDGGPADWAPLLIFDGAAADNDPYLLAAQDGAVGKRSRYYRRYPWKRQPGRGGGASPAVDYNNPYLCNPTREDVFQLLVALHEARAGNLGRTVSFCNRRRPAASVFTNIRFLGRRRRR